MLILALSYVLRIGFFTYALYVVLALVVTSRLTSEFGLRGVVHRRQCDTQRARIGEVVPVAIEVKHTGKLPLVWLLAEDLNPEAMSREGSQTVVRALWPGRGFKLAYELVCLRRGYHQIGPLLLETGDLFGLVRRFAAGERAHYVTVYPEIVPIAEYDVATRRPVGEVRVERRIFEDPSRLRGVRDYQPGDKLTRIHWRSTARTGQLQTKVFEPSTMIGALMCLDMYEPAYEGRGVDERSEFAVVAAASLSAYVSAARQRVGFISNGRDAADRARYDEIQIEAATIWQARRLAAMRERSERLRPFEVPVGRGELGLQQILDATARVELSDFQPLGRMLLREYPRLPRDVALLLIVPTVDEVLLQAIAAMRHSGFIIRVMLVGNHLIGAKPRGALLGEGVPVYHLDGPNDLARMASVRL